MAAPGTTPGIIQFGVFEADLAAHELRRSGRIIKLQEQPFQVLALLLQSAGEVVEREQLRRAVWPEGTFVEFDHSLNTAVKKIRHALRDAAENPRFIETLPRRGYRFIAPVSSAAPAVPAVAAPKTSRRAYWIAGALVALVAAAAAAVVVIVLANRRGEPETVAAPVPFATYPGVVTQPSFSPDGERVAFSWNGPAGDNFDIYVKQIGTERPLRLTTNPAVDSGPAWSPDGRLVAFLRELPGGKLGLIVVPGIGGPERILTETRRVWAVRRSFAPAWTPDGKWIAYSDSDAADPREEASIYAFGLDTGEIRRLTYAPAGGVDLPGTFSQDGRSLILKRVAIAQADAYLLRLTGDFRPDGAPARLTSEGRFINSPAWTADGREIVYVSLGLGGGGTVWHVPVDPPGKPRRLKEVGNDDVRTLAAWGHGNRLIYERRVMNTNIWRTEMDGSRGQVGPPVRLIASSLGNGSPMYSPDGKRIAFASARSGHYELWICGSDGSDPVQLTDLKGRTIGPPRWSADGKRVYFDANADGKSSIYVIDTDGRNLRRLTNHSAQDAVPSLSADGRWVYFGSSHLGRWEIWKMPAEGGDAAQVTRNGGLSGFESPDGRDLYYSKSLGAGSLWRRPVGGGAEQEVAKPVLGNTLALSPRGIYFARPSPVGQGNEIAVYSFANGQTRTVATTAQSVYWYLSVSPDDHFLLWSQVEENASHLMLVDHFR